MYSINYQNKNITDTEKTSYAWTISAQIIEWDSAKVTLYQKIKKWETTDLKFNICSSNVVA